MRVELERLGIMSLVKVKVVVPSGPVDVEVNVVCSVVDGETGGRKLPCELGISAVVIVIVVGPSGPIDVVVNVVS